MTAGGAPRTGRFRISGRVLEILALAAISLAFFTLFAPGMSARSAALEEDEGDYLRAATHLLRDGVLAHSQIGGSPPAPDAYREPGISFLVAAAWRLGGCEPPPDEAALGGALAPGSCTGTAISTLNLLLFAATVAGAAVAAHVVSANRATALAAAALVAMSPALRFAASGLYSENLAAPLFTLTSALLAARFAAGNDLRRPRLFAAAAVLAALAPLARSALLVLPFAGALVLLLFRGGEKEPGALRIRRAALFLALGLLPAALWVARNHRVTGIATLADTRAVLAVRAGLDEQIGREGAIAAGLTWTPLASARNLARKISPEATFNRYEWTGEGNYYTRAHRKRRADPTLTPFAADRAQAREALAQFARQPLDHLRATFPVAWRGLFAERSPAWTHPFDLSFGIGLTLALAFLALLACGLRGRQTATIVLLLPSLLLFLAHAFLTENLPRYNWPALALSWAALVLILKKTMRQRNGTRASTDV